MLPNIAGAILRNLVSLVARIASIFRSIAIVIAIAVVFLFGVATTVYLSLRSPEVKVPDVVGKDRFEAEKILADAKDLTAFIKKGEIRTVHCISLKHSAKLKTFCCRYLTNRKKLFT